MILSLEIVCYGKGCQILPVLRDSLAQAPKMREVYALSWHEQLSNKEIAARMSISEGTVKQHKHQALRILRGKLQRLVAILFF